MLDLNLQNKVIVVVGGSGLIGSEIVKNLLEHGCKAVVADVKKNQQTLEADFIELDICSSASVLNLINSVASKYSKIDALVNCSYPRNQNWGRKFEQVTSSDFNDNVSMHLGGYFLISQQFALFFKKQGFGNIINFSSIYGHVAPRFDIYEGTDMTVPVEYSVIKAGIEHLTRYMVKYFKGAGIRFNTLSPGGIFDNQAPSFLEKYQKYACNKGMLSKQDIIGAVLFLISDLSLYVNGQNITVDDGWI